LLLILPGVPHSDVYTPVSLISLGPTVADLFGLEASASREPSLLRLLENKPTVPTFVLLDELEQFAVVHGEWKLILGGEDKRFRLHNVLTDPEEEINLVERERDRFLALKRILAVQLNRDPYQFRYFP
jgi:arylsulfatase A-like enzyme